MDILKQLLELVIGLFLGAISATKQVYETLQPGASGDGEEESSWQQKKQKEECYQLVATLLNYFGYICRNWFSKEELASYIEGGMTPVELAALFRQKLFESDGLVLGELGIKGSSLPVKLPQYFQERHVYIIGRSGSGKTTLIRNLVLQHLEEGQGLGILAPEAELIEHEILPYIPKHRIQDVIYINPQDTEHPISLNPLYLDPTEDIDHKVDDTTTILRRIIGDGHSYPRMDEILRQTLYALIKYPDTTLLDVSKFLSKRDDGFRREVLDSIQDEQASEFFLDIYPIIPKDAHIPIINRLSKLLRPKTVQALLCAKGKALSFRKVMDQGRVLLCNLSDGLLGAENASVLGQLIVSGLQLAAMSRADMPPEERKPFALYLDEFQAFVSTQARSYEILLSRARKYRLSLVLAHQQSGQIPTSLLKEILGNVSTMVCFSVGSEDANRMSHELVGEWNGEMVRTPPEELLGLRQGQAIVKIQRTVISVQTHLLEKIANEQIKQQAIDASRATIANSISANAHEAESDNVSREEMPPEVQPDEASAGKSNSLDRGPKVTAKHWVSPKPAASSKGQDQPTPPKKDLADPADWIKRADPKNVWGDED